MNYAAHYDRLISRARDRVLTGYYERHHILPRCMGGLNEPQNLVDLTAEEHYVAHQLLVKIYPYVSGLVTAAVRMSKQCTGNKAFGWLKRKNAILTGNRVRGIPKTPEHRAKISKGNSGRNKGPQSLLHRTNISNGLKGNTHTLGLKMSDATREKMSSSHLGKRRPQRSKEWIEKWKISMRHYWTRGKAHQGETPCHSSTTP